MPKRVKATLVAAIAILAVLMVAQMIVAAPVPISGKYEVVSMSFDPMPWASRAGADVCDYYLHLNSMLGNPEKEFTILNPPEHVQIGDALFKSVKIGDEWQPTVEYYYTKGKYWNDVGSDHYLLVNVKNQGEDDMELKETVLSVELEGVRTLDIYLPAFNLPKNYDTMFFWVMSDGSTYYAHSSKLPVNYGAYYLEYRDLVNISPEEAIAAGDLYLAAAPPVPEEVWVGENYGATTDGWTYDHFDSIQDAVDAVAEYGTVKVAPGTYEEGVTVSKDGVALQSTQKHEAQIKGTVTIDASNVKVDGFKITDFDHPWADRPGVFVQNGEGIEISNNLIDGEGIASEVLTVGVHTHYGHGDKVLVEGNEIKNVRMGIYNQGATMIIEGNTIESCSHCAIGIDVDHETRIADNFIKNNENLGLEIHGGMNGNQFTVVVMDNTFERNGLQVQAKALKDQHEWFNSLLENNTFDAAVIVRHNPVVNGTVYSTISEAIEAAVEGDTIEVEPGEYDEDITVEKPVTITAPKGGVQHKGTLDIEKGASGSSIQGLNTEGTVDNKAGVVIYNDLKIYTDKCLAGENVAQVLTDEPFTVTLDIGAYQFYGYQVIVKYDADLIAPVDKGSINEGLGDVLEGAVAEINDSEPGRIEISRALDEKEIKNGGCILVLEFVASKDDLASGESETFGLDDITVLLTDGDGKSITATVDDLIDVHYYNGQKVSGSAELERPRKDHGSIQLILVPELSTRGELQPVNPDSDGKYEFPQVYPTEYPGDFGQGLYTLTAEAAGFLKHTIEGIPVAIDEGLVIPDVMLLIGDIVGNGKIGLLDLFALAKVWGEDEFVGAADLNSDGTIDVGDLTLLARNWGKKALVVTWGD